MSESRRARSAATHSLLNCYLRETDTHRLRPVAETPLDRDAEAVAVIEVPTRNVTLLAALTYVSPTGRHRFDLPVVAATGAGEHRPCSVVELATMLGSALGDTRQQAGSLAELVQHVVESTRAIERFLTAREEPPTVAGQSFRETEQSLVFGHQFHPTPKSRCGIAPHERDRYAPEREGSFALDYFSVDPDLVTQESATDRSTAELVGSLLRDDPAVSDAFVETHVDRDRVLVPVHPWQADYLRSQSFVRDRLGAGIEYHESVGSPFYPTSSVRTLYSPDAPFMVKGSLHVRITNSTRVNKARELDRGVAISELLDTDLGQSLEAQFPAFEVVRDPAYITVDVGPGAESGFETILRENPFRGDLAARSTPVVALCQDGIDGTSRLQRHIEHLADREGRTTAQVSEAWFQRYLDVVVRPVCWLYLDWGLGLEAHQQNTVVALDEAGYPDRGFYRDNQGFFFPESRYDRLDALLPGVGERCDTVRADALTDEAIEYYVFINNVFGVVNAFGRAGLIDERRLLTQLRATLDSLRDHDHAESDLLGRLLDSDRLTCKANLLMRFHDVDELTGSVESQIVTTAIDNPLADV